MSRRDKKQEDLHLTSRVTDDAVQAQKPSAPKTAAPLTDEV
jgi:hypothetical protein